MPLVIRYDVDGTTVETWGRVREAKLAGVTTKTDQGTVATSKVDLPDPDGDHVVRGLRRLYMSETDCPTDFEVIYDGYLGPHDIGRDEEHILGSSRLITVNLVDHNTLLTNYLIHGAKDADHGVRPDETDLERIAWLLASPFTHPINDFGAIATTGGVMMDGADLRGQNAGNVFRDCALISGRQWFLYYDESQPTVNRIGLFYNDPSAAVWASTLRLSNHPGDADGDVTFDLDSEQFPVQHVKPDTIVSDVIVDYDGGQLFIACEEIGLTTRDDYYVKQLVIPAPNVKTEAMARRLGEAQLRAHSKEETTASVRVLLPSTHIGLIQPGHRIEARFDHFDEEYRAFTFWRVQEHRWAQKSRKWYWLNLELEPTPGPGHFLVAIILESGTPDLSTPPADLSAHPWTVPYWSGDFCDPQTGGPAGPPQSQAWGIMYREVLPGETTTIGRWQAPSTGIAAVVAWEVAGVDLATILGSISVIDSGPGSEHVADGGTTTLSATASVPSVLFGGTAFGKVNYDSGWCPGIGMGHVVITAHGTEIMNKSAFYDCDGGPCPWAWVAWDEGSGALSVSAVADSGGGGFGAYTGGYNTARAGLLMPTMGPFSVVQVGHAGTTGASFDLIMPSPPVPA